MSHHGVLAQLANHSQLNRAWRTASIFALPLTGIFSDYRVLFGALNGFSNIFQVRAPSCLNVSHHIVSMFVILLDAKSHDIKSAKAPGGTWLVGDGRVAVLC